MSGLTISMVNCATDTETRDITVEKVWEAICTGGTKLKGQITQVRNRFEAELSIIGDRKKAKLAVDALKKQLPGVTPSGRFKERKAEALIKYSGVVQADLDSLGEQLVKVREKLKQSPHVFALFLSPTGDGLKAWFRASSDPAKHLESFRAVEKHVKERTGVQIDQSCKDIARLCFMSYDPHLYVNDNAVEITPLPEPEKPKATPPNGPVNLSERQRIATELLGDIEWQSETSSYVICPGKHLHTTGDGERDCKVELDGSPTVHCFHNSCRGILDGINHELRKRTGKAENARADLRNSPISLGEAGNCVDVDTQSVHEISEHVELPPAPVLYVSPPLTLLPAVLQDFTHAAAESLNVDVAFVLLPLLSSLGAAVGNSRSILLKRGFVQPPVIWTGIVGRGGARKSPAIELDCFAVMAHERELMQQNEQAAELYADELAGWESKKGKKSRCKPDRPPFLTCTCDDLTIEVLADILVMNPRGVLVRKDELSHWLASFDQYKNARGSDISRWLSLHTAVSLAVDRRTDSRHYRIANPRVSISGGIQPEILRRVLTPEFFERGLPARFIFAFPPYRKDRWSEEIVTEELRSAVLELFAELWLLQSKDGKPVLLPLDGDAKAVFIEFYNRCGESADQSNKLGEAAWGKLSGYGARLALASQLAHNPQAQAVTGAVMEAACNCALWAGNESVRIYGALMETPEQREQRELIEFIERRGGAVCEREVMLSFSRLKNNKLGTERELTALVKAGRGKWEPVDHTGGPGRPTRKFRLLKSSTSTQFGSLPMKTGNSVDVDAPNSEKITARDERENGAVPENADWPEGAEIRDGKVIL